MKQYFDSSGQSLKELPDLGSHSFFLSIKTREYRPEAWKHHWFRLRFSLWQRNWAMPEAFRESGFPVHLLQQQADGVCKIYFDERPGAVEWWMELGPVIPAPSDIAPEQTSAAVWNAYWNFPGSKQLQRQVYEPSGDFQQLLFSPDGELMETSIAFALPVRNGTYVIPLCRAPRVHSVGLLQFLEQETSKSAFDWESIEKADLERMDGLITLNAVRGVFKTVKFPILNFKSQ